MAATELGRIEAAVGAVWSRWLWACGSARRSLIWLALLALPMIGCADSKSHGGIPIIEESRGFKISFSSENGDLLGMVFSFGPELIHEGRPLKLIMWAARNEKAAFLLQPADSDSFSVGQLLTASHSNDVIVCGGRESFVEVRPVPGVSWGDVSSREHLVFEFKSD